MNNDYRAYNNDICIVGSSLCGLADSDAVLYLRCGWNAGIHAHRHKELHLMTHCKVF